MFAEEWPLLTFTLLTQLAVGSYIFFVMIRSSNKKRCNNLGITVTKRGMFLIGPVMLVALIFSVFHLGTPFGAYRSILNLDSSWLSREILFSGGFFALWIVSYYLDRKGAWNQMVGWITSIVGIGAIFCMASIYTASIRPAWTDANTYLAFYGTTLVFGAAASMVSILLCKEAKSEEFMGVVKRIGLTGLGVIFIQLIYLPVYVAGLPVDGGQAGVESVGLITGTYAFPTIIRWVLSTIGLAMIGFIFSREMEQKAKFKFYYAAFVFVLVGEFLGRYIFYGIGVSIIVG
ncbi:dimethyl sulfoxide reductase anchor subunit family protein [Neobacillus drentensis]|uniref:dimethyl sulfoxide reductase anchor subunit family protein n=1 Tax=Neobacillus drentensis TaxID=220684 RepID=UPI000824C712|nr:DmsC/YnfH family molybdoenzyme membrane anchor subunit [Neobacillus drentensis]